jgi:4-amino-4-deoxy-L-arabinose transferase-like glycosyltransferase
MDVLQTPVLAAKPASTIPAKFQVVISILAAITVVKIVVFAVLAYAGVAEPFVGTNAENHYIPIAERLLAEGRFNGPESRSNSKVPIGYPAFLAIVKVIAPHSFLLTTACLQMGLDFLVACLVYVIALGIDCARAGAAAGVAWLLYPPEVVISTWITAETLLTALLMLSLLLLWRSLGRRGLGLSFGAGLVLGAATLVRGTCLWLPPFLLPLWLSPAVNRGLLKGAAYGVGMLCLVLPWTLRNQLVLDDPIMVSVGTGHVFLQGSDEQIFTIEGIEGQYSTMFDEARKAGIERPPKGSKNSTIDSWMLRIGLHNYQVRLQERPQSILPFAVHKFVRLWYGIESGGMKQQILLACCSVLVVPLGLWQLWRWRTGQPQFAWLLGLVVLYFIGLHWITLPEYRYMHVIYPVLLLGTCQAVGSWLAGYGLTAKPAEQSSRYD